VVPPFGRWRRAAISIEPAVTRMDIITASVPVSPRSGATAQPDDVDLGGDVDFPAPPFLHSKQGNATGVMTPSR
jgi:hypothetical protein